MDSKLITSYFAAITKEPIHFKNEVIHPRPLVVSKLIFRGFTCPESCGACCTQPTSTVNGGATLNYLPSEARALVSPLQEQVLLNNKYFTIFSEDMTPPAQVLPILNHSAFPCKYLSDTARCTIYADRSIACDLPLLQVTRRKLYNQLTIRKFGRHHLYKQFDLQTRGTKCELLGITPDSIIDTRRRLIRLYTWSSYFTLKSWMPEIINWSLGDISSLQDLRLGF